MSSTKETKEQLVSGTQAQNKPQKLSDLPDIPTRHEFENFGDKFSRKVKQNPLVPIGLALTVGALSGGLYSLVKGNRELSQRMMRYRVLAQGFTVFAVMGGVWYQGMSQAKPEVDSNVKS